MEAKCNDIRNKLYQMFILGLEGTELDSNVNLKNALERGLGGVIFFTQNIKSIEQVAKLTSSIKSMCKIPPFLSIDEEGGRVERTENIFGGKNFKSAKFAAQNGEEFLIEQTNKISKLLKSMGINLNFAPCLDVNSNPKNPIIGERAFSNKTEDVIKYGKIVSDTYLKNKIIPCSKHFPGHGDASIDSHISMPEINLSMELMEKYHISPFREVFAPLIMVAHLHCTAFDLEKIPASLSKNVINYIRTKMNYQGLLITDDMVMGGVASSSTISEKINVAKAAILSGVNILLYRDSFDGTINLIEKLAEIAEIDKKLQINIEKSHERICNFKTEYSDYLN